MWHAALCALVGAGALSAGCTTDETGDGTLQEGTFAVTSLDLGSCSDDTWLKSRTTASSIVVEASGDTYALKTCAGDGACSPMSPSTFAWNVDVSSWRGEDGGAYLVETGCLLVYVDATARIIDNELVIETNRWSSVASGSCTYDEVLAMRDGACDDRTRLTASIE
jgi:hypothetical protein